MALPHSPEEKELTEGDPCKEPELTPILKP